MRLNETILYFALNVFGKKEARAEKNRNYGVCKERTFL
jgi:hypothetical protein